MKGREGEKRGREEGGRGPGKERELWERKTGRKRNVTGGCLSISFFTGCCPKEQGCGGWWGPIAIHLLPYNFLAASLVVVLSTFYQACSVLTPLRMKRHKLSFAVFTQQVEAERPMAMYRGYTVLLSKEQVAHLP